MADTPASILIVDGDRDFARTLASESRARGYRVQAVTSVADAVGLVRTEPFDALLVDVASGADSAFELLSHVTHLSSDTEVIVMSDRTAMTGTIQWSDPDAFASVRKSDFGQLFGSLAGVLERRHITAQNRRLHQNILQAKREWEQTFDAISDPIAVFNDRGEVLRGNRALATHLELPVTGISRLTCDEVGFCGCAGDTARCAVTRALAQQASRAEVTLPDDRIFSVTTFPIGPASDGPSVVQVAKNVTDEIASARRLQRMSHELTATNERLVATLDQLKATQAQLVQAEKLSAIGQLVAGVAHELNNPLTSVIGYAQLVEEELRAGPRHRPAEDVAHDLRRIAEESERAARIVRNLLTFARCQGAARAPQDLVDVCQRVIALREYSFRIAGVQLATSFVSRLPKVLADGGQLQQVLLNLVLNAEQAMRNSDQRRLAISVRHDLRTSALELRVADTGHGIESANLSRIFDPFFTTREVGEGTGLGLSICYGIVRDHGGQITVDSRLHEGTTFTVLLPASQSGVSTEGEVLVVHPEQAEREFIAAALRGWGYRPQPVATSHEAADVWRRASLQFTIVDRSIVSADPAGWHGRKQAGQGRRVPLILTSIAPDNAEIEHFGLQGAAATLAAPVTLGALNAAVLSVTRLDAVSRLLRVRASAASHANGARRRSGARESVPGSSRGEAPRLRKRGE